MIEPSKFVSGVLSALSTMVNLEIPHLNIITKLDLLNKSAKKDLERFVIVSDCAEYYNLFQMFVIGNIWRVTFLFTNVYSAHSEKRSKRH